MAGNVGAAARMLRWVRPFGWGTIPRSSCVCGARDLVAKRAGEIEDKQRPGLAVKVREAIRHVRRTVVQRGWHNTPILGGALRWIGRHTP